MDGFYLTPDETLDVVYNTYTSGITAMVNVFGVINDERRLIATQQIALTNSGVPTRKTVLIGPAYVESCVASIVGGTPQNGAVAIGAQIVRKSGSLYYVAFSSPVQYPSQYYASQNLFDATIHDPDNGFLTRSVSEANPGAGTDLTVTVPTHAEWFLQAIHFTLTTDATVANRYPILEITDGTNVLAEIPQTNAITATTTGDVTFARGGLGNTNLLTYYYTPLPDLPILTAGYTFGTVVNGLQAADTITGVRYLVRQRMDLH